MRIDPCAAADLLAALHAAAFSEAQSEVWSKADIADLLMSPGVLAHLARERDDPIGFILARIAADEAEVLTLAVRPDFRRRGAGRALVAAAAEAAEIAGAKVLFLEVAEDNLTAVALYESCGFRPTGRRKDYYVRAGARIDALALRRELNRPMGGHYA